MPTRFPLSAEILFRNLADLTQASELMTLLARHQQGDWGLVSPATRRSNNTALQRGLPHRPLVSRFPLARRHFVVITTHRSRGQTTVEFTG